MPCHGRGADDDIKDVLFVIKTNEDVDCDVPLLTVTLFSIPPPSTKGSVPNESDRLAPQGRLPVSRA